MATQEEIERWVDKKPIVIARLDNRLSRSILDHIDYSQRFTFTKPTEHFGAIKLPTFCIIQTTIRGASCCLLCVAMRKHAVATTESRVTLDGLVQIDVNKLDDFVHMVERRQSKNRLVEDLNQSMGVFSLTPSVSKEIVNSLSKSQRYASILNDLTRYIPYFNSGKHNIWAQENAISMALHIFGQDISNRLQRDAVRNPFSKLSCVGGRLREDNVISHDARTMPGFLLVEGSISGRALFQKGDEELEVITANRTDLESMFGVDLIYINKTLGSLVMVQYKMLEQCGPSGADWVFRPKEQDVNEIDRMYMPSNAKQGEGYRLNSNPFYFKFVKRKIVEGKHQSIIMSLDHVKQFFSSQHGHGPRGGVRLSYEDLDGAYLRERDIISLIRSGYIGTTREETDILEAIIQQAVDGDKALVIAWQRKVEQFRAGR